VREEDLAGVGERHRTAGAVQQLDSELPLELADRLAERRL
jgi:hypothetical protein